MASRPFFSILLPTKNRAHLVGYAIQSVLNQDYADFELIIADNDDTDATSKVVQQFNDDRIRYIRTGGLDMVQNWNTALNKVGGKYVLLLEDKFIFYQGAFSYLYEYISKKKADVIVWRSDVIDDSGRRKRYKEISPFRTSVMNSRDVLETFLQKRMRAWDMLPRGLCTCVNESVISNCITRFGSFYDYLSPDLVSALRTLLVIDQVYYLGVNLNCIVSLSASNGVNFRYRRSDGSYYGKKALDNVDLLVPVKEKFLVSNLVAHDIEAVLQKSNAEPLHKKYKKAYYASLMREIGAGLGGGVSYDAHMLLDIISRTGFSYIPYKEFLFSLLRSLAKKLIDMVPSKKERTVIGDALEREYLSKRVQHG